MNAQCAAQCLRTPFSAEFEVGSLVRNQVLEETTWTDHISFSSENKNGRPELGCKTGLKKVCLKPNLWIIWPKTLRAELGREFSARQQSSSRLPLLLCLRALFSAAPSPKSKSPRREFAAGGNGVRRRRDGVDPLDAGPQRPLADHQPGSVMPSSATTPSALLLLLRLS